MTTTPNALLIAVDGTARVVPLTSDHTGSPLTAMQEHVGGYVEALTSADEYQEWIAWVDEEGFLRDKPANPTGDQWLRDHDAAAGVPDLIRGPVLVTGPENEDGTFESIPDYFIEQARASGLL